MPKIGAPTPMSNYERDLAEAAQNGNGQGNGNGPPETPGNGQGNAGVPGGNRPERGQGRGPK